MVLEWLKDKVKDGLEAGQRVVLVSSLTKHFAPLEDVKNGVPGIASRLSRFVVQGADRSALQDLQAKKGNRHNAYSNLRERFAEQSQSYSAFVKTLPQDPDLFVRLALVYDAAYGRSNIYGQAAIPGFGGHCDWVISFLWHLDNVGSKGKKNFPAKMVEEMVTAEGADPSVLVSGALLVQDAQGKWRPQSWLPLPYTYFRSLDGFSAVISRFPELVRQGLSQSNSAARAYTLGALQALEVATEPFAAEIALLAISGSKEVRESAEPIVKAHFNLFRPLLEASAAKGSSDERYNAVRLLAHLGGAETRAFLSQRSAAEKASKVADVLRELLSNPESGRSKVSESPEDFGLQPVADVPVKAHLDKTVLDDLRTCVDEFEQKAAAEFANNQWAQKQNKARKPVPADTADRLYQELQDFQVTAEKTWPGIDYTYVWTSFQVFQKFAGHPKFELIHLVRWCLLMAGRMKNGTAGQQQLLTINHGWAPFLRRYQHARKQPIDLRNLAAAMQAAGLDGCEIGHSLVWQYTYAASPFLCTDPSAIWPYFAERPHFLEEAFGLKPISEQRPKGFFYESDLRKNAFAILSLFPRPPARLIPILWEIALGPSKTERPLAQKCLDKLLGKEERIVAAAGNKQLDARLAAAEWLANLKYAPAIPALKAALAREKSEIVRDEQIRALEALGVSLESLLDVDRLDQDAEKGLRKGIPTDLDWFPFAQLPAVRWADSGEPVSPRIIEWFLVQGCKLKDAEASPSLRRYCSLFRKDDREKLGRFVLDVWIAKDIKPKHTPDQASVLAQQEAAQAAASAKRYPQYYPDFDEQKSYQAAFSRFLIQPEGSQNGTKGILALSGACCGGDVAPIVHRYVKQWFGYRGAQCKALLQVLAWIDSASATQVVLSIANRFRTKGIQEEAMRLCQMLAERKGWTFDELADRTIPTCGLDEQGIMELDYGSRTFTVRLSAEMAIEITNQNGKTIASLPDANQSDDAEKARAAKATLSVSRKELKSVLAMQKDRLYEALCTQRSWLFAEWQTHLRQHPLVGRFCQRLVWSVCMEEKSITSFRPMADGSLTDNQDDEVKVKDDAIIRLAHEQTLEAKDGAAWIQHFADYKVEPLFQQFGKQTFALPTEQRQQTEITQFRGHILKAFSLRNRLTRFGYTRGAAQDGGWFFEYQKGFAGLGIDAIIEFTGNGLPEENRTVALQRLYFARKKTGEGLRTPEEIPLGELPAVLLAECWNDIRMAAADGPGFQEDWEKQTGF
jgi:hypothetical protein